MCAQLLGRGRAPRLSIGTLQLSIRCSSIHFRPSRSLPVSDGDELIGATWFGRVSCAGVADVNPAASNAPSNPPYEIRMTASQTGVWNMAPAEVRLNGIVLCTTTRNLKPA
jgi:hypothetical protein